VSKTVYLFAFNKQLFGCLFFSQNFYCIYLAANGVFAFTDLSLKGRWCLCI